MIGFAGNEFVARLRIKVGKEINSAALEADGHHARMDGLTSLSVLLSTLGVWLGYPLTDPVIGLLITLALLRIVWEAGKTVLMRLLDGVDPQLVEEIKSAAKRADGVEEIAEVRVSWIGRQLLAEVNLAVNAGLSVAEGHSIAENAHQAILHQLLISSRALILVRSRSRIVTAIRLAMNFISLKRFLPVKIPWKKSTVANTASSPIRNSDFICIFR